MACVMPHVQKMTAASFEFIEVFYNRPRRHSTLDTGHRVSFLMSGRQAQHEKNLVA